MAQFFGQARSNYFAVKDAEAFKTELANYPVEVITQEKDGVTLYGFIDADENGEADLWSMWDEEEDETVEVDWAEVFKRHLQDDWVAVIISVGWEKYRYFQGDTVAFNNKGESKTINLEHIYELAKDLGSNRTFATY
jgi:LAS superfamily LD-carboxypeptidase LdcB